MNTEIFREYDIRGVADTDLNNETVFRLGKAIGTLAKSRNFSKLCVGHDCRASSERIRSTLIEGLMVAGIKVTDVGLVPTPMLYHSIISLGKDGGVMITGSHNPSEYNGFKIVLGTSTIHGSDIQNIREIMDTEKFSTGQGSQENVDTIESYIKDVVSGIKMGTPPKVVLDAGNGMAGMVAPRLIAELGCDVTTLYGELDGTFPNHHPDPTVLENLKDLSQKVVEIGADIGIGFDGDADRIGIVDSEGKVIYGDELMVIYSRDVLDHHPGATIISEVKASYRLYNDIEKHGGHPIMWKTGHSLIKAKMQETGALLAGEMSGHMFFKDRYYGFDDAVYAAARIVEILSNKLTPLRDLLNGIPDSVTTPEIRVDCPDLLKFRVVEQSLAAFKQKGYEVNNIDGARVEFEDGWGLVRASNTQPVLVFRFEATSHDRLLEIRKTIEGTVNEIISRG